MTCLMLLKKKYILLFKVKKDLKQNNKVYISRRKKKYPKRKFWNKNKRSNYKEKK